MVSAPCITCTIWKRRPMMRERRNRRRTWSGVALGGDVVVLGDDAGDLVAHRAADDVGLVARLLQCFADAPRTRRDLLAADAVLVDGDGFGPVGRGLAATEDAAQQLADHAVIVVLE